MDVTDIDTPDWQLSLTGLGELVTNADDINQCLNTILATQKGTDPMRFDFGIDLISHIDKPVTLQAPALVNEIITQVAAYETRIKLKTVNYNAIVTGQTLYVLTWFYKPGTVLNGRVISDTDNGLTTYFLLADQNGFVLLSDYDVSVLVN